MPRYLATRGRTKISIAICARCSRKFPWTELMPDPNAPGLMVCKKDRDQFDPWRLPPRAPEPLTLPWARPDVSLAPGPYAVPVLPLQVGLEVAPNELLATEDYEAIAGDDAGSTLQQSQPWSAATAYASGAMVTAGDPVGTAAAGQTIYQYQCVLGGVSGATAPSWSDNQGALTVDNNVIWINAGLYLP